MSTKTKPKSPLAGVVATDEKNPAYRVVICNDLKNLCLAVNAGVDLGYEPVGGVTHMPGNSYCYAQAMFRRPHRISSLWESSFSSLLGNWSAVSPAATPEEVRGRRVKEKKIQKKKARL